MIVLIRRGLGSMFESDAFEGSEASEGGEVTEASVNSKAGKKRVLSSHSLSLTFRFGLASNPSDPPKR